MRAMIVLGLAVLVAGCDKDRESTNGVAVQSAQAELGLLLKTDPKDHGKLCAARQRLAVAYQKAGRDADHKKAEAEAATECAAASGPLPPLENGT